MAEMLRLMGSLYTIYTHIVCVTRTPTQMPTPRKKSKPGRQMHRVQPVLLEAKLNRLHPGTQSGVRPSKWGPCQHQPPDCNCYNATASPISRQLQLANNHRHYFRCVESCHCRLVKVAAKAALDQTPGLLQRRMLAGLEAYTA